MTLFLITKVNLILINLEYGMNWNTRFYYSHITNTKNYIIDFISSKFIWNVMSSARKLIDKRISINIMNNCVALHLNVIFFQTCNNMRCQNIQCFVKLNMIMNHKKYDLFTQIIPQNSRRHIFWLLINRLHLLNASWNCTIIYCFDFIILISRSHHVNRWIWRHHFIFNCIA